MKNFALISLLLTTLSLASVVPSYGQNSEGFLNLEFEFGLGYAKSKNNNLFNDQQGVQSGGGVALNIGLRYHLDYNWSFGLHALGYLDEVSDYDPDQVLGYYYDQNLSLSNFNLGFNGRYTHNANRWQPYAQVGLGVGLGSLTIEEFEETVNSYVGADIDLGGGVGYMVTNQVMISASIFRNYGLARWDTLPSFDSINRDFNPGFWSVMLGVSVFFGENVF